MFSSGDSGDTRVNASKMEEIPELKLNINDTFVDNNADYGDYWPLNVYGNYTDKGDYADYIHAINNDTYYDDRFQESYDRVQNHRDGKNLTVKFSLVKAGRVT